MPHDPIPHMLQTALQHQQAREFSQAESLYRQVLQKHPDHPDALHLLGIVLHTVGRSDAAVDLFRRAISIRSSDARFHRNLALVLQSQQRFNEAAEAWRRVAELEPRAADAPAQLGALLIKEGRHEQAIEALRRAAALDPNNAGVQSNFGSALALSGRIGDSIEALRRAVDLESTAPQSHHNLAVSLRQVGLVEEAEEHFRAAIRLNPTHGAAGSGLLLTLQYREHDATEVFAEHKAWARRNTSSVPPAPAHRNDRDPMRRLRVGYVSADLRQHSVGFFIEPLLAAHDAAAVEVFCYSGVDHPDETTRRIERQVHHWRTTQSLSDEHLAHLIRQDAIDILVDLSGHTAGHRLLAFARKPAPIQLTYLGYPDTTGLTQIDYRITDVFADPSVDAETLVRLPRCAWCYRPYEAAPRTTASAFHSNGHITFGSFNTLAKLSPTVVDLWTQLLRRLSSSRLVLKSSGLEDFSTRARFLSLFTRHHIDPARITLLGKSNSLHDHLESYNQIDIAVDSYPYHGTTSTCEALWMGVPVITLAGDCHVSRVGVSLNTAVGLPELIADSPERYIEIALDLAHDTRRLSSLRASLRDRMKESALTDAPALARAVEHTYRRIWTQWCGADA